jgi:hypothetical protein
LQIREENLDKQWFYKTPARMLVQPQTFTTITNPHTFFLWTNLGDVDSSLSRLIWLRETLYTELELEHILPNTS